MTGFLDYLAMPPTEAEKRSADRIVLGVRLVAFAFMAIGVYATIAAIL